MSQSGSSHMGEIRDVWEKREKTYMLKTGEVECCEESSLVYARVPQPWHYWHLGASNSFLGKIEGSRKRGRPNRRWTDCIKEAIGLCLQELSRAVEDRTLIHRVTRRGADSATDTAQLFPVSTVRSVVAGVCAYWRMFSSIPGLYPLDASGISSQVAQIKTISRYCPNCHCSGGGVAKSPVVWINCFLLYLLTIVSPLLESLPSLSVRFRCPATLLWNYSWFIQQVCIRHLLCTMCVLELCSN